MSKHNHFRQEWNGLWNTCANGPQPQGNDLAEFLQKGIGFCFMLNVHHSIEEARVSPQLRRMPEFEKNELMESHHVQIHAGLEDLHAYLEQCQGREARFELGVMKGKMEPWREVLWTHLDAEVRALGAENMRKYFTVEEVRRLGM
ncbi:hypothetical protein PT974_02840 [Cladobotryum mycophilum]|uniref:Hemerythrin-like domain-containing protein n=1 Tax=Cladobotryum mycophilum TaxID=491253 RepID=A0ABR0SZC4_9HYPO